MGPGMSLLQYASCLDNSNHNGAGRSLLPVWTLFRCQSTQYNVRYLRERGGKNYIAQALGAGRRGLPEPHVCTLRTAQRHIPRS